MLTVIHLEPEDFYRTLLINQSKVEARMYVLKNNIAGIVYTTKDHNHFYYLDRFFPSSDKKETIEHMNSYDLHKEIYQLINLDERNHRQSLS